MMVSRRGLEYVALLGMLAALGMSRVASPNLARGDTWIASLTKADMPTARKGLSTSVVNGKIYAIGGSAVPHWAGEVSTVEEYDPATDTWAKKADMPTARGGVSTSVVEGKIYAIGGATTSQGFVSAVEQYDPMTDTWTTRADMPTPRAFLCTNVVNGRIYAIGGLGLTIVEEYDPATDTWTRKADMPTLREHLSTSVVNGRIYAIGGGLDAIALPTVEEYDPATDTWTRKADMPSGRFAFSTCVVDGKIYAVGGASAWQAFISAVEEYNPATDTWTQRGQTPTPRWWLSASVVNARIYAIGGCIDVHGVTFSTVEEYRLTTLPTMESASMTPDVTKAGEPTPVELTVTFHTPLEASEQMILDLSPLGAIPSELRLKHVEGGRYTASTSIIPVRNGRYDLPIIVLETTSGARAHFLTATLDVYPAGDRIIYEEGSGDGWSVTTRGGEPDLASSGFVHSGDVSHAISLSTDRIVTYTFDDPDGIALFGYTHLEFYINGGAASGQDPMIGGNAIESKKVSDLGGEVQANTWTLVSIPIAGEPLKSIYFTGGVKETFYIDDMKLVAMAPPEPAGVERSEAAALPSGYALFQNYPNPFNPTTTIAYHLSEASHVHLDIYSIIGQHVATLVSEHQKPGRYTVSWDARAYANGVYFVRLKAGSFIQTRRMVHLK